MRNTWILAFLLIIVTAVLATHSDQPYNPYLKHPSPDKDICDCVKKGESAVCANFDNQLLEFSGKSVYLTAKRKYAVAVCKGKCVSESKRDPESNLGRGNCFCTENYAPECALIGKTFITVRNHCEFLCRQNEAAKLVYYGTCKAYLEHCKKQ